MPVALRRITPAVVQSIQVFFQVVLYAGLFIFAQYLVSWLHFAAACQPGGDDPDAGADCLSHSSSAMGSSRGALAIGRKVCCFFVLAVVAVVNYAQLLLVDGWRIFAVIALSTVMVLGTTAWVVEKVYRYEMRRLNRG